MLVITGFVNAGPARFSSHRARCAARSGSPENRATRWTVLQTAKLLTVFAASIPRAMMRVTIGWDFVMPCALNQQLGELLVRRRWMLAVAESCTGGGLASCITAISGSSAWFDRGFVTYQAAAKTELLGVTEGTLRAQGQVSAQTALEMAEGAIRHSHAQIALSITGIAGPTGAVTGKPVGTVFFGMALKDGESQWRKRCFSGNRETVRESAIQLALSWLIERLEKR